MSAKDAPQREKRRERREGRGRRRRREARRAPRKWVNMALLKAQLVYIGDLK